MNYTGVRAHCICSFHGQWIPGDERGWRSRQHKSHSSGDYHDRPPATEHEGLRHYVRRQLKRAPVVLRVDQRSVVGAAFVRKLQRMGCEVRLAACGATHLHVLLTLTEMDAIRQIGKAKQFASLKLTDHVGQLWGERSKVIPIRDELHLFNACDYIRDHAHKEEAWLWPTGVTDATTNPSRT